ncbi:CopD family protein [Nonomuraea rubra]|uniref:CopD family protein n=1 Tax=Nonomuraea rubra TaxID=46180 RepID=UPI0031E5D689
MGLSGVFALVARLGAVSDLWTTEYGLLAVAKIVLFVLLGYIGYWHRQRTLGGPGGPQAPRVHPAGRRRDGAHVRHHRRRRGAVAHPRRPSTASPRTGPSTCSASPSRRRSPWQHLLAVVARPVLRRGGGRAGRALRCRPAAPAPARRPVVVGPHRLLVHRRRAASSARRAAWPVTPRSCSTCT